MTTRASTRAPTSRPWNAGSTEPSPRSTFRTSWNSQPPACHGGWRATPTHAGGNRRYFAPSVRRAAGRLVRLAVAGDAAAIAARSAGAPLDLVALPALEKERLMRLGGLLLVAAVL